jgi:hypothetical protein
LHKEITMAPKTMLEDLTDLAVSVDSATPSECQPSYLEEPTIEDAGCWGQRCNRLRRRLEKGFHASPLAERSAWAVVQGLQRARAMSAEIGNQFSLDYEGGGEDALMTAGTRGALATIDGGARQRTTNKTGRLTSPDQGEV